MPSWEATWASCGCGRPPIVDHVADGEDARLVGLHPLVDLDVAALELDLGRLQAEAVGDRPAAHGHQQDLGGDRRRLALGVAERDLDALRALERALGLGRRCGWSCTWPGACRPRSRSPRPRGAARAAPSRSPSPSEPKRAKTDANSIPTAPAPITIRLFGTWSICRISSEVMIDFPSGVRPGMLRGFEPVARMTFLVFTRCLAALALDHDHAAPALEPALALEQRDLVLLEEVALDPLGQAVDDAVLAALHRGEVEARAPRPRSRSPCRASISS